MLVGLLVLLREQEQELVLQLELGQGQALRVVRLSFLVRLARERESFFYPRPCEREFRQKRSRRVLR